MTSVDHPGELEQMVLLAVLRSDNEAYALSMLSELEARVRRGTGDVRRVELHWHEARGVGRRKFKIKRFLD